MRADPLGRSSALRTGRHRHVKLLYFAWVRQKVGTSDTYRMLNNRLSAFANLKTVRVAVNQRHSGLDAAVGPDDEVAFFPPVTGG